MADKVTADELRAVLGADSDAVTVDSVLLQVKPLDLLQIADALECVERLAVHIGSGGFQAALTRMVLRGGHDFVELMAIATRQPREWAGGLNPVDGLKLAKKVYEVNLDFFGQNTAEIKELLGPLWDLASSWISKASKAGLAQFSDSSSTDTGSKTSGGTRSRKSASSAGR